MINNIKLKLLNFKIFFNFVMFYYIFITNKNKKIIKTEIPKVSVFLPIYNKERFLKRSISSIQKQTLKEIEIIAVNDFSLDNSLKILKQLSKKDQRIKIINNDRNHGLLYSRAMGILNSTGEYVMNLDPDDKFYKKKDLETLYNRAKELKADIIIFRLKKIYTIKNNISKVKNDVKIRSLFSINSTLKKWQTHNLITNKFIKRKMILKAYNYFKKYIFKNKWNYGEDNIWSILIKHFSKSIAYFNKFIYIYFKNEFSLMNNGRNDIENKNVIYRLEIIKNFYNIKYINTIFKLVNRTENTSKKDIEVRKRIIRLFIYYIKLYKNNKYVLKAINTKINELSNNKIIIINYNNTNSTNCQIYRLFKKISNKKLISIDISSKINIHNFNKYYIFDRDIFLGFNNLILEKKLYELIKLFPHNKFIIFINRTDFENLNFRKYNNLKIINIYKKK